METPKTVHVVFGMSAAGSVRQALSQLGCGERVIGFMDDLSFGPIDGPQPGSRETWIANEFGYDLGEVCEHADRFWAEVTAPRVLPIVWVGRNHALEYTGFIEFVWRMADRPFHVIDVSDVEGSLGVLNPGQIMKAAPLARRAKLTRDALADLRALWRRLRTENAPFRVVGADGLVSAPITFFDEAILSCTTPDWRGGTRVVGETMEELYKRPHSPCPSDIVIWSRVLALGETGRLEVRGSGPDMRGHEVRGSVAGGP